uniref:Uncharacterized protein n=1 Tax=Cryptomonas curvata TaxID=233186 RepID=A0A7S0MVQ5_9CRYP
MRESGTTTFVAGLHLPVVQVSALLQEGKGVISLKVVSGGWGTPSSSLIELVDVTALRPWEDPIRICARHFSMYACTPEIRPGRARIRTSRCRPWTITCSSVLLSGLLRILRHCVKLSSSVTPNFRPACAAASTAALALLNGLRPPAELESDIGICLLGSAVVLI